MIEILLIITSFLLLILGVLIRVAFIILIERKVLGYIQIRKGPNKARINGIFQSLRDAIKLFIKEQFLPIKRNFVIYLLSPITSLFLIIFMWSVLIINSNNINFQLGGLFFFCCTRFGVYRLIGRGWSSNSNYTLIGAIRGMAQTISYEVRIALIFLSLIILTNSFNLFIISKEQYKLWFIVMFTSIFICWFSSTLAETNRTPFDFAEGESELVSGFNTEYSSGGFALLFLAEYARIIFMRFFIILLFFGEMSIFWIKLPLLGLFFIFSFLWVRSCLPRFRYDKLINLAWKYYLPVSLTVIFLYILIKILVY